jgi:hypothetical protein
VKEATRTMRKWPIGALLLALALGVAHPGTARADDIALKKIMRNGAYGGVVGAMIGGALLVFVNNRSDHLEFITTGAAAGVLVGVGWGIYDSSSSNPYVMIEDGKVHASFSAPKVLARVPSPADRNRRETIVAANLLGVRF